MRTALYRHYDAAGVLLYVGISCDLQGRDISHARQSVWHDQVFRSEVQWCLNKEYALALEVLAVQFEKPLHNIQHAAKQNGPLPAGDVTAIKKLIRRWPSRSAFADEVGANVEAVHKWARSGRIPSWQQHSVVIAAAARGMEDVTPDWLMAVHMTQGAQP